MSELVLDEDSGSRETRDATIPLFEELAPGSFRYGGNYLIEFEPDSLWNESSQSVVAAAIKSKIKTEYHVFQRTYEDAQRSLEKLGIDVPSEVAQGLLRIIDSYTITSPIADKSTSPRTQPFPGGRLLDLKKWDEALLSEMKRNLEEKEKRWLHVDDNTSLLLQYNSEDAFFDGWRTFFIPWGKERELITLNAFVVGFATNSFYKKIEALYDGIIDFATRKDAGGVENVVRVRALRGRRFDSNWRQLNLVGVGNVELASKILMEGGDTEIRILEYLVDSYVKDNYVEARNPRIRVGEVSSRLQRYSKYLS